MTVSWIDFSYMHHSHLTQVGACIVNKDSKVVGVGYNGFVRGISDDDPDMTWSKDINDPSKVKYPYGEKYMQEC